LFGVGTFGAEGVRPPKRSQLEYLVGMASQIVVALSRIRYLEASANSERSRLELERRLLQVQKLESLGMLAGGIAHDFNNLLTVISASAGILKEELTDVSLLDEVAAITGASTRATDLTRKLLAMSRTQPLSVRPLDVNRQLRELLLMMRRLLPETIDIDLIEAQGLPLVEGDSPQLDQVFMNIFINARDAMLDGGRLTIESEQVLINGRYSATHPWAKPGRYVLVTITDTGVGMSPEVVERIFEPFFTTKGQRAGTGLGLAVAYGVVRQHRGMLHCYSEVGVGTAFKIYLPAIERRAEEVGTKIQRRVCMGTERVLVAEDDELVRGVAVRILERAGYKVTAVENGAAACDAAAAAEFDLIVLDVVMPGMSCQEVVDRLRLIRPQMSILLSSGYTAGASIAPLMHVTGHGLLRKPYDPDQMLRAVRDSLDPTSWALENDRPLDGEKRDGEKPDLGGSEPTR
jgi:signal transduction histidine kinase/ActR/RegA family two-component response regulator